ncbi:hypothetical protein VNI00_006103 [Paramarasmius palmivorus]|uniref:BZIP domain-containing protein n=1 Tax=Paramarasmius palmivorus TaxID=297713 RepID=A0AAW0D7K4_9AGAR
MPSPSPPARTARSAEASRKANKVACANYRSRNLAETRRRARERMRRRREEPSVCSGDGEKRTGFQPPKYRHKGSSEASAEISHHALQQSAPPLFLKFKAAKENNPSSSGTVLHPSTPQNHIFIHHHLNP